MHRSTNESAHLPPIFSWISIADVRKVHALPTDIVAMTWSSQAVFKSVKARSCAMFMIWKTFESCRMIFAVYTYVMNWRKSSWRMRGKRIRVGVPAGEGKTVLPGILQISPRFEPWMNELKLAGLQKIFLYLTRPVQPESFYNVSSESTGARKFAPPRGPIRTRHQLKFSRVKQKSL